MAIHHATPTGETEPLSEEVARRLLVSGIRRTTNFRRINSSPAHNPTALVLSMIAILALVGVVVQFS